ncbi:MAG: isochorismatase family cysteine hydrolase, partial [Alphaproteobacteria bacterium]
MTATLPPIDAPGGLYREQAIDPCATALLSIDMQHAEWNPDFAARARRPDAPESRKRHLVDRIETLLIPNQQRLQAAARAARIEVVYTIIESLTRDGRDRSLDHKISRIHHPPGSAEAAILSAVGPAEDEIVIPKTASGVFNSTNIEYVLRNLGVRRLVVYGSYTDQCVVTAIRDAGDRGFR